MPTWTASSDPGGSVPAVAGIVPGAAGVGVLVASSEGMELGTAGVGVSVTVSVPPPVTGSPSGSEPPGLIAQ